jgi:hypothetical protein
MFNPQTLSVCPEIAKLYLLPKKVTALATSIGKPPWPIAFILRPSSRVKNVIFSVLLFSFNTGAFALIVFLCVYSFELILAT